MAASSRQAIASWVWLEESWVCECNVDVGPDCGAYRSFSM